MSALSGLALVWALAAVMMTLGWWWQKRRDNAGIVDVLWSFGVGGSAIVLCALGDGAMLPRLVGGALGGLWGLRLALHLWHRVSREPEDGRYRYLREHWNGNQLYFWLFFQFQALLIVLFALPFVAVAANPRASIGWAVAAPIRRTRARPCAAGCGATRGTRTTSSSGRSGSPMSRSRSAPRASRWPARGRW